MSPALDKLDLGKLTHEQRLKLLAMLLDTFTVEQAPLPDWVQEMAAERLAEIEKGDCTWESWEDVKKELLAKWK